MITQLEIYIEIYLAMKWIITLLLLTTLQASAQYPTGCSSKVSIPGPANIDTSHYATIYLIRDHYSDGNNYWYYVCLDSTEYIKTNDNEKYIVKVYKEGNYEVWTQSESRASVRMELKYGRSYYINMWIIKGDKHPQPILSPLDSVAGAEAFKKSEANEIYIDYPIPATLYLSTTLHTSVEYQNAAIPVEYGGRLKLYQPSWAHVVEYIPVLGVVLFSYYDPFVSETYSEDAELRWLRDKSFKDSVSFQKFVNQQQFTEVVRVEGETVLNTSMFYDVTLPGQFKYVKKISAMDTQAKNIGDNPFLKIETYVAIIYVDDGYQGKVYKLVYTQRGLPGELHNERDFKCRFRDFAERISVY